MTDTKKAALSMALEYWRNVDPSSYSSSMMAHKQGGTYKPADVVNTALIFSDFLDGAQPKKRRRG